MYVYNVKQIPSIEITQFIHLHRHAQVHGGFFGGGGVGGVCLLFVFFFLIYNIFALIQLRNKFGDRVSSEIKSTHTSHSEKVLHVLNPWASGYF